ncbi:dephospho-CoA kinase [Thalassoporum mexicanum PCC 7367]|uniref:dephospho-CoA kinase n=1 Tax=Thalassoporum mexicanum TaxID=3457544 RepID=UPI00029FC991|nr:dephospho-CoA kinase [Pseudanabaena sp. PCC 7367]AFY70833.1 dephospho-CoA kinase [Pseudanabaena sp. PCC 7367]
MTQRMIGLTGGIATGKTLVSDYLGQTYNLPILDADVLAREAVDPAFAEIHGGKILKAIAAHFGSDVLKPDRTLNRAKLGELVFTNPDQRNWLEAQIHPYVRDRLVALAANYAPQTVVMAIPLLFEAKLTDLVTEIWLVVCEPEQQLQRLIARNNLSIDQAKQRIDAQMPLVEKVPLADYVLDNSAQPEDLYAQVDRLISAQENKNA